MSTRTLSIAVCFLIALGLSTESVRAQQQCQAGTGGAGGTGSGVRGVPGGAGGGIGSVGGIGGMLNTMGGLQNLQALVGMQNQMAMQQRMQLQQSQMQRAMLVRQQQTALPSQRPRTQGVQGAVTRTTGFGGTPALGSSIADAASEREATRERRRQARLDKLEDRRGNTRN